MGYKKWLSHRLLYIKGERSNRTQETLTDATSGQRSTENASPRKTHRQGGTSPALSLGGLPFNHTFSQIWSWGKRTHPRKGPYTKYLSSNPQTARATNSKESVRNYHNQQEPKETGLLNVMWDLTTKWDASTEKEISHKTGEIWIKHGVSLIVIYQHWFTNCDHLPTYIGC